MEKTEAILKTGSVVDRMDLQVQSSTAIQRAEVEISIATAKQYPRDIDTFRDELMSQATATEQTAQECVYALPRDGKTIEGPSIRLAEIALCAYGNLVVEGAVSGEDANFVYAVGMARDLQRNISVRRSVRRRITKKGGERYGDDMIVTTAAAATSIAIRDAIFTIIPQTYINPVYDKCRGIKLGSSKTLGNMVADVLARLLAFGVEESRVLALCNKKIKTDLSRDDVGILIGIGVSIKEGQTTAEDAFPPVESYQKQPSDVPVGEVAAKNAPPRPRRSRKAKDETPPVDDELSPELKAERDRQIKELQEDEEAKNAGPSGGVFG